jgi:hypothetical protein
MNNGNMLKIQDDAKLLSGFPYTGHGKPDNNLASSVESSF